MAMACVLVSLDAKSICPRLRSCTQSAMRLVSGLALKGLAMSRGVSCAPQPDEGVIGASEWSSVFLLVGTASLGQLARTRIYVPQTGVLWNTVRDAFDYYHTTGVRVVGVRSDGLRSLADDRLLPMYQAQEITRGEGTGARRFVCRAVDPAAREPAAAVGDATVAEDSRECVDSLAANARDPATVVWESDPD